MPTIKKAKITDKAGYKCAPQGHTVVHFEFGEMVEGKVANWAVADGAGKAMFAKKAAPKNKAQKAAPENKGK